MKIYGADMYDKAEENLPEKIYGADMYDKADENLPENKHIITYIPPMAQEMIDTTKIPANHLLFSVKHCMEEEITKIYGVHLEDQTDLEIPENAEEYRKLYIPEVRRKMIESTIMPVNSKLRSASVEDR